jgi:hypothetical protein
LSGIFGLTNQLVSFNSNNSSLSCQIYSNPRLAYFMTKICF